MNSTVESIKDYISREYNIDFKLEHYRENTAERWLKYKTGKKEYTLSCDYARQPQIDMENEYWCIYEDFMDYEKWHGNGSAVLDKGNETIDQIMQEWGFKKNSQLSLF